MEKFLPFLILLLSCTVVNGQVRITGTVADCETGEGLVAANVSVKNTTIGTVADIDGTYSLEVDSLLPLQLVFSYVGYQTRTLNISQGGQHDMCLEEDVFDLYLGPLWEVPTIEDFPIHVHMPVPFMKLQARQLQRDNDVAITPALNRVTGVYMHSGALNTNRITIRGIGNRSPFSTTKIRAYLDDIPLTTGDGETTIEDIDLSLLHKIQVWKGPTASIYGAGLGGMIQLQTDEGYLRSYLSNKTTIGSYGLIRNSSDFNFTNKNEQLNIRANFNTTQSDGYRDNNEYDRQGFTLLGKVRPNNDNETTLLANHTQLKAFIPSSLNREDYENEPTKAAFTWGNVKGFEDGNKTMLGVSHRTKLAEIEKYDLKNKTSLFAHFRDAYELRPFNVLDEESKVMGLRSSFELNPRGITSGHKLFPMLSVGLEVFNEKYDWKTFETNDGMEGAVISDNKETRKYYNIFSQYYGNLTDRLSLLSGLNLNSTRYDYKDLFTTDSVDLSGKYSFDPVLSPQLGLSYQINYNLAFFATASHGFSPPSLSETLTPGGIINPNIQPEKGWNIEVGSRGKIDRKLTYEITLYNMIVRDLLVAERIGPDQFVGVNAGKTRHSGLELYADYIMYVGNSSISLVSNYTYSNYKFIDFKDADSDHSGNELTGTAPHNFNIGLDVKTFKNFYGHFNFKYVDTFPMRDDNSIYSDAYQVMDMKLGFRKTFFNHLLLDINAGIRNVLDEKYASMILINAGSFGGNAPRYYYPGLPRNYYAGLSLKYWL